MQDNELLSNVETSHRSKSNVNPPDGGEKARWLLVRGAICLSVFGVIAFLITGQVAVVLAMNAPLLAIIGKEFFSR